MADAGRRPGALSCSKPRRLLAPCSELVRLDGFFCQIGVELSQLARVGRHNHHTPTRRTRFAPRMLYPATWHRADFPSSWCRSRMNASCNPRSQLRSLAWSLSRLQMNASSHPRWRCLIFCMSSSFTIGTFLFRSVDCFAMASVWV